MPCTVYYLVDPRDGVIRWVGITRQKLARRLANHACAPNCADPHSYGYNESLRAWVAELAPQRPLMRAVCVVENRAEAERIETHLICARRSSLLNKSEGVGTTGLRCSESTKQKISDAQKANYAGKNLFQRKIVHTTKPSGRPPEPPGAYLRKLISGHPEIRLGRTKKLVF